MATDFDPYYKWLGIPPEDQPPDHYQLLGLRQFEADPDVIEASADRQMAHIRSYQSGKRGHLSQQLLNELASAKLCLLSAENKSAYDLSLREQHARQEPPEVLAVAKPLETEAPQKHAPSSAEPRGDTDTPPSGSPIPSINTGSRNSSRHRFKKSSSPLQSGLGMALGGLAVLVVAIASLWYGLGIDPADSFSEDKVDASQQVAQAVTETVDTPGDSSPTTPTDAADQSPTPPPTSPTDVTPALPLQDLETPAPLPDNMPAEQQPTAATPEEPADATSTAKESAEEPETISAEPLPAEQPPESESTDKHLPPNQEAEAEALAALGQRYAEEYEAATSRDQKIALAKLLLRESRDIEDDPTTKYTLLRVARDIFNDEGSLSGALDAVAELNNSYQIDRQQQQATAFLSANTGALDNEARKAMLMQMQPLLQELSAADRFEIVKPLMAESMQLARRTRDAALIKQVLKGKQHFEDLAKQYEAIEPALETLATNPDNGEANLTVGMYHATVKHDWQQALEFFSRGNDPLLKTLAEKELAQSVPALAIADGWWDLAELRSGTKGELLHDRAGSLYRAAWQGASELERRKIEKRVTLSADTSIDLDQWNIACWNGHWDQYDLSKVEIAGNEQELLVRDTSGIHDHIYLKYKHVFNGDFYLEADVIGAGENLRVGLTESSGKDSSAYVKLPESSQWKKIVIRRSGADLSMTLDGQAQKVTYFYSSANLIGRFSIKVLEDKVSGVRNLIVLE